MQKSRRRVEFCDNEQRAFLKISLQTSNQESGKLGRKYWKGSQDDKAFLDSWLDEVEFKSWYSVL